MADSPTKEETPKNLNYVFQFPRHLDSALHNMERKFYHEYPVQLEFKFPQLTQDHFRDGDLGIISETPVFPWLEDYLVEHFGLAESHSHQLLQRAASIAAASLDVQTETMTKDLPTKPTCCAKNFLPTWKSVPILSKCWHAKRISLTLHNDLELAALEKKSVISVERLPGVEFHQHMVLLKEFPGGPIAIPFNWLLNVLDRMEGKFHMISYVVLANQEAPYKGSDFLKTVLEIYGILEKTHRLMGSGSNKLSKSLEALCTGVVLESLNKESNEVSFLQTNLDDLMEADVRLGLAAKSITEILKKIQASDAVSRVTIIMEMYGLEKHTWFPVGDEQVGLDKMRKYGTSFRPYEPATVTKLKGMFVKKFIHEYYTKEDRLPDIAPCPWLNPKITAIWVTRQAPSWATLGQIPLEDWAVVIFEQTFDFDYYPDPLDLLDDKSAAPDLSNANQVYNVAVRYALNLPKPKGLSLRRLVDWMLAQPKIDIERWFEESKSRGSPPPEECLILLMGKELENKVALRMFSILHPKARLKASVLERNISKVMFKYFVDQSMSNSGSELKSRIDSLVKLTQSPKTQWVVFHLDLTQWNYCFRDGMLATFEHTLNQLFGVSWYNQVMWPFRFATFQSGDAFSPPGIFDRQNHWTDYPGGNQGICQKLWTLVTQLAIYVVMEELNLNIHLIGAGDNQVVFCEVPLALDRPTVIHNVKTSLAVVFEKIGLELKVSETWHSDSLVAYQRKYYFRSIPLNLGIKQTTKFSSGHKDGVNSLRSQVETAMASGMNLADSVRNQLLGPFLAYTEMYSTLLANPAYQGILTMSDTDLVALSWAGSELGLLPIIPLQSFLYYGHKDHMAESFATLKKIYQNHPMYKQSIAKILQIPFGSTPEEHYLELVLNPLSPHLSLPDNIDGAIRSAVEKSLMNPGTVRNLHVTSMFSMATKEARERLAKKLLGLVPLNLAVAHEMYESHLLGLAHAATNKLCKIKTLTNALIASDPDFKEEGFRHEVIKSDRRMLKKINTRLTIPMVARRSFIEACLGSRMNKYRNWVTSRGWNPECSFSARMFLQHESWKMLDTEMCGVYCPSPLEQVTFMEMTPSSDLSHSILVTPARTIPLSHEELENTRGPFEPFIGTSTKDTARTFRLVPLDGLEAGAALKAWARMLAWAYWLGGDPNLIQSMKEQIEVRAPGLSSYFTEGTSAVAGGTLDHRFGMTGDTMDSVSLSRSTFPTWISLSTNSATGLQRGDDDRLIFFQQIYQWILACMRFVHPFRTRLLAHIAEDHCSYPVAPQTLTLKELLPKSSVIFGSRLCLSTTALSSLSQEMELKTWVLKTGLYSPGTLEGGLAGTISLEIAKTYKNFQRGSAGSEAGVSQGRGIHYNLNKSILRLVPIPKLFASLVVACAFRTCFGPNASLRSTKSRLLALASQSSGGQDSQVFRPLIAALTISDKIKDLAELVGHPPQWSLQEGSHHGAAYVAECMLKSLLLLMSNEVQASLVVEIRHLEINWEGLHRFLTSWCPKYRALVAQNPNMDLISLLQANNGNMGRIKVIITDDPLTVQAHARQLEKLDEAQKTFTLERSNRVIGTYGSSDGPPAPILSFGGGHLSIPAVQPQVKPSRIQWGPQAVKVPHHAHNAAKWASTTSSGRWKMLEVLSHLEGDLPGHGMIMCLAEGAGSMMSALMHEFPTHRFAYNSLIDPEEALVMSSNGCVPPELLCSCGLLSRCINVPYISATHGDLTLDQTWEELDHSVRTAASPLFLITMDLEGEDAASLTPFRLLSEHLESWGPVAVIIKTYLMYSGTIIIPLRERLIDLGYTTQIVKPFSSNPATTEVYLVGTWRSSTSGPDASTETFSSWVQSTNHYLKDMELVHWCESYIQFQQWMSSKMPCSFMDPLRVKTVSDSPLEVGKSLALIATYLSEFLYEKTKTLRRTDRGLSHLLESESAGAFLQAGSLHATLSAFLAILSVHDGALRPPSGPEIAATLLKAEQYWGASNQSQLLTDAWRRLGQLLFCWNSLAVKTLIVDFGRVITLLNEGPLASKAAGDFQYNTSIEFEYVMTGFRGMTQREEALLSHWNMYFLFLKAVDNLRLYLVGAQIEFHCFPSWEANLISVLSYSGALDSQTRCQALVAHSNQVITGEIDPHPYDVLLLLYKSDKDDIYIMPFPGWKIMGVEGYSKTKWVQYLQLN